MGDIVLAGATSGTITLTPTATAGSSTLTLPAANGTVITTASSGQSIPKAALPTGSVLQVAQATFTGTQTIATGGVNANWTDVTNLSVTITPTSATSKMLLFAQISNSLGDADRIAFFKFTGGNTINSLGASAGNRTSTTAFYATNNTGNPAGAIASFSYLDSPATSSAITYKVQACANFNSGNGLAINYYYQNDIDAAYISRGASSLIVMEIAA